MTVSTTTNTVVATANGATVDFPFPFKVLDENHLVVTRRDEESGETVQTYTGADYTVTGVGDDEGNIEFAVAPADGFEIVINRVVPFTQELDLVNQSGFYPQTVEEQLDSLVMQVQQVNDKVDRAPLYPFGSGGLAVVIPAEGDGVLGYSDGVPTILDAGSFRGPAGTVGNNSGVTSTVPVTPISGNADYNYGHKITMGSPPGHNKDVGLEIDSSASNQNTLIRLIKPIGGGGDYLRVIDPDLGYIKTRIGSGGQIESVAWINISGSTTTNGYPVTDPRHTTTFAPTSAQSCMVQVFADVPVTLELRGPDTDPSYGLPLSIINGKTGGRTAQWEETGDIAFVDGWEPVLLAYGAAEKNLRDSHVLARVGRRTRKSVGPKGASLGIESYTTAELNDGESPDAVMDHPSIIHVSDGAGSKVYVSNGSQFALLETPATVIGPDSFGWVTATWGPSTYTETGTKVFEKTAGAVSWDGGVVSTTTLNGDFLVEATLDVVDVGHAYMFGISAAVPVGGSGNDWQEATHLAFINTVALGYTTGAAITSYGVVGGELTAGDRVGLRSDGGVLTLELNGITLATINGALPNVGYYMVFVANQLGSKISNFRRRVI